MEPDIVIEHCTAHISTYLKGAERSLHDPPHPLSTHDRIELKRRIRILKAMLAAATKES